MPRTEAMRNDSNGRVANLSMYDLWIAEEEQIGIKVGHVSIDTRYPFCEL